MWGLTAEAIRLAIELRLATMCRALTQQWLRPFLQAEGVEDWHRYLIWYDSSPLRVRANRSETALQVYDRGVISDGALRRETGFDDDVPSETETNSKADKEAEQEEQAQQDEEQDTGAEPTGTDLPVDETQETPDPLPASAAQNTALLAAVDGLIWTALSLAGKKLAGTPACPRSERGRIHRTVPAEIHTQVGVDETLVDQYRLLEARRIGARPPRCARGRQVMVLDGGPHADGVGPRRRAACYGSGRSRQSYSGASSHG
ncbi:hypothetical protein OG780_42980 [Streptomyces sp. NBC_00386]|uniref:hypothetical protein n=1 Tax=Streptomyces sp. NBC_00386 TaxID=2975734 RepID=UPI002E1C2A85